MKDSYTMNFSFIKIRWDLHKKLRNSFPCSRFLFIASYCFLVISLNLFGSIFIIWEHFINNLHFICNRLTSLDVKHGIFSCCNNTQILFGSWRTSLAIIPCLLLHDRVHINDWRFPFFSCTPLSIPNMSRVILKPFLSNLTCMLFVPYWTDIHSNFTLHLWHFLLYLIVPNLKRNLYIS